jgi:hypothetical protein
MPERRKTMRAPCRLRCRAAKGSEQIAARIVDVSKEGLCLISPDWLEPKEKYEISIDSVEPKVFRIRCKATGGPRSRVLSLAADSEEQARALATRDLGDEWAVLEVREA